MTLKPYSKVSYVCEQLFELILSVYTMCIKVKKKRYLLIHLTNSKIDGETVRQQQQQQQQPKYF